MNRQKLDKYTYNKKDGHRQIIIHNSLGAWHQISSFIRLILLRCILLNLICFLFVFVSGVRSECFRSNGICHFHSPNWASIGINGICVDFIPARSGPFQMEMAQFGQETEEGEHKANDKDDA
jgi:hypothetical protein